MTLTSQEASRMFTCPPVVGCCVGAVMGFVVLVTDDFDHFSGLLGAALVVGAPVGALVGAVLGLVLGVPIALVTGALRPVLSAWRGVGAALAGAASGGVVASVTGVAGPAALLPTVMATLAAAGAWIGLGRIYGRTS